MKLKEEYKGLVISKRIEGKVYTFDTNKESDFAFYSKVFPYLFESKKKKVKYKGVEDSKPEDKIED